MDRSIAAWRLRTQHLSAPHAGSALDVVRHLLGVQAENPSQSAWAVATRTQAPDPADLAGLLASGDVLRTHVLRSTWHYVAREDLDPLLALMSPRLRDLPGGQLRRDLGFTPAEIDRLGQVVVETVRAAPHRTRSEIAAAMHEQVPDLAPRATGRMTGLLLAGLEMDRRICSGTPREAGAGKDPEHTYAAWEDRIGSRVELDEEGLNEAVARLAWRYLVGHGPATAKDLAYWATLTPGQATRGIAAVRDRLSSFEHDGRTFWHPIDHDPPPDPAAAEPRGHLLQVLDEMYRGYQDSRWVLDPDGLVPRGRETAIGMALVAGQLVAGMKRTLEAERVRFDLTPHRALSAHELCAIDEAATRYGAYLGRTPVVRVTG
ncbi:winged helix DNA-binding domain-containing protein [Nocardioides campestrisoli]|uniref:winged helix DNA-binding domain-containing protein n=1 Tax=Nocardioides campestrisoli TaxID=2736757 RepID=UPI00163D8C1E|nr:winged helix DNA-binding domain-containing protein [Nocardioides campestrisoli]